MKLRASALCVLALAGLLGGCSPSRRAADPGGSTLRTTYADRDGNGVLEVAGGERFVARTELGPVSQRRELLTSFAQITDAHVRDVESPARASFLDRLGGAFSSTFRPQETLTLQVLDAAVRAVDAQRPDAVVETGDLVDNVQLNEFDAALKVLRGGRSTQTAAAPGTSACSVPTIPTRRTTVPVSTRRAIPACFGRQRGDSTRAA